MTGDVEGTRLFEVGAEGLPDLPGMMLATLRSLRRLGGSAHISELDEDVIETQAVSEAEQAHLMPDGTRPRVNYFLAWARTYLRRAGLIENSARGVWTLTERGRDVDGTDRCRLAYDAVQAEERARTRARRAASRPEEADAPDPPGDPVSAASADASWRDALLAVMGEMDPAAFERLAQRLLREAGFTKVEVRGKTGDGGIDGVGVLRVNLVSFQVYFQCKRWKGSVGSREIRDFRGALMGRADKGIFLTTGTFTAQAGEEATRDGATAIDLIDGRRLCDLLKEHGLGVRTTTRVVEEVSVDPAYFSEV